MHAKVHEAKNVPQEGVHVIGLDVGQVHRVGRVVDVVDLKATWATTTTLVRVHQDVAGVHRCNLDIVGAAARW